VKESTRPSRGIRPRGPTSTAEDRLIAILERELAEARRANAKLLRMVEMVIEERFYRPTVTGGVRENLQTSALPLESLSDVTAFDEAADIAQVRQQGERFSEMERELRSIESEHHDWRTRKGLANEEANEETAVVADPV